jgi:hypothetical protein
VLSGLLWQIARKEKWRVVKRLSGLVFVPCGLVVAAWLILYTSEAIYERLPGSAFKAAFGQRPPPGTVVLHGRLYEFFDSERVELAFRAEHTTFDRLRPLEMKRVSVDTYHEYVMRYPPWWSEPGATTEIWLLEYPFDKTPPGKETGVTVMTWNGGGFTQFYRSLP